MNNKPIQRWGFDASMFKHKTGDYVLYADHVAAMEAPVQPLQPADSAAKGNRMTKKLLQQALDALDLSLSLLEKSSHHSTILAAYTSLEAAIAQPVQPAGQLCEDGFGLGKVMWFNKPPDGSMLYASSPIVQPVKPDNRLADYMTRNYPDAKGNDLTERVINALETMDIALGMKDIAAQRVQTLQPVTHKTLTKAAYLKIADDLRKVKDEYFIGADVVIWCEMEVDAIDGEIAQPADYTDIHSCSYSCHIPARIKAQRDELAALKFKGNV